MEEPNDATRNGMFEATGATLLSSNAAMKRTLALEKRSYVNSSSRTCLRKLRCLGEGAKRSTTGCPRSWLRRTARPLPTREISGAGCNGKNCAATTGGRPTKIKPQAAMTFRKRQPIMKSIVGKLYLHEVGLLQCCGILNFFNKAIGQLLNLPLKALNRVLCEAALLAHPFDLIQTIATRGPDSDFSFF